MYYDVRAPYTTEMGRALANQMDAHVLQMAILAARASGIVTGIPGGSTITPATTGMPASADLVSNGNHIAEAIYLAAEELDDKDVPETDRYFFVRPHQYYALVRAKDTINKDWGGRGSFADGNILKIAGMEIIKTRNLPNDVVSAGTTAAGTGNKYAGDFSNVVGLAMHSSAVGTVKLWDLGMESEYQMNRQGTLMLGKYLVGHGILRPEAAVEVLSA